MIAVVIAWLLYVAVESTSFQICIADKEDKQPKESAEKNSPEILGSLVASARVRTDCVFVVLDENRDAMNAIATAFIAIFTAIVGLTPQLDGEDQLFVWITISYHGPFTKDHETSACWRYYKLTNRLIYYDNKKYNYMK